MDDQSVYINQLQEDLEAKIEQIEKLEGFLKYMVERYADDFCGFPEDGIQIEISDYIKELSKE